MPADASLPFESLLAAEGRAPSALEQEVTALFDELRNPLLRYLLSFGLSAQDGEEVVQEVFLALFRHLREGKPRQNLRGWLFRVAHNLGLKKRNQGGRGPESQEGSEDAVDPSPNPEVQAVSKQAHRKLLAVFGALPEQDQRCIVLRSEGLRYREIAEVLNMSLGSVAQSLERSLARIARVVER